MARMDLTSSSITKELLYASLMRQVTKIQASHMNQSLMNLVKRLLCLQLV